MISFAAEFTPYTMPTRPIQRAISSIIFLALVGCSSAPDTFGTLDLKTWRSDRNACKNLRADLINGFKAEQKQLLGKFIDEVGSILGRPDIHQLGERNTKFYVYFLEKGSQCDDITKNSSAKKVVLKFNAVGLLSEITYQDGAL
jgi:hypothetical protein